MLSARLQAFSFSFCKCRSDVALLYKWLTRFTTDSLKKNPVMGEDELEQISGGLGKEAVQQGLGGVSDKLGSLEKL